ncbi:gamma-glutamyl-gamma-aminobutyrate hydrolase PuuD [Mycetocola sp. BIGb0189]|uniref:gamma-glutamyl-gamma-aminobutyrate hydrolase family protein n=1 Tax=Mycetocola sp. BIGb0189 TaxID=2940604 RepID=UPI0021698ADB|nr:type 1 glutamine amidotransferase [Mycetocola sp. BIGb0189]MCS4274997.1 gamma-glutamyl-gamma-aminobutyrate hydrolase PuuD [Mycetocola sp. BIGb0189]
MASNVSEPAPGAGEPGPLPVRPRIGITGYRERASWGDWSTGAVLIPESYVDAVAQAGGLPLLLAPGIPGDPADYLDGLDGLVIAGGPDITPLSYGAPAHPATRSQIRRDALDLRLCAAALGRDLPLLGICRGAQVLNVVRGGTLHQHIPDLVSPALPTAASAPHEHRSGVAVYRSVPIFTEPATRARSLLGARLAVPCYHHQAIDAVGHGLTVSARADDGTIEAVEDPAGRFVFAVQFHPETAQERPELRAPVRALVRAARAFALARAADSTSQPLPAVRKVSQ